MIIYYCSHNKDIDDNVSRAQIDIQFSDTDIDKKVLRQQIDIQFLLQVSLQKKLVAKEPVLIYGFHH